MTQSIAPALDAAALHAKSQHYIRKALEGKAKDDLAEYQLWASLALELLGKSALSAIHASLIANPQHSPSLFAAAGIIVSTDIKTITAKTLFERLKRLIGPFDRQVEDFCNQVANRRNAELHSGDAPFAATRTEKWEAEYWYTVDIILGYMGSSLEQWLGADDAAAPQAIVFNAALAKQNSVEIRVNRARESFEKKSKSERKKVIGLIARSNVNNFSNLFKTQFDSIWTIKCPSCSANGIMGGELVTEEILETQYDAEIGAWELVGRQFIGEQFRCPACRLELNGYDELGYANLPADHEDTDGREMEYEPDYGND